MPSSAKNTVATVTPSLHYRDAPAVIDWPCKVFGFEKHAVHADGNVVHHAQLAFGHGMVMLGSVDNASGRGRRIVQPDEIDGRETQACDVIVADCAAHYVHATSARAEIVDEPEARDHGGSGYSARDAEGHLWSFGEYDSWAEHGP